MGLFDFLKRGGPRNRFANRVMARLRERGWPHELRYEPDEFLIQLGGNAGIFNLQNVFHEWLTYPVSEQAQALDSAVDALFEPPAPATFEEAAPLLLPIVRNRADVHNAWFPDPSEPDGESRPQSLIPLADSLAVMVAIDRPASTLVVEVDVLEGWGCSLETALARAIENLRAQSGCRFVRNDEGYFVGDYNDYYDASRILLPEVFSELPLRGQPVIVLISRQILVVCGSEDALALKAMAGFVNWSIEREARPISRTPFIFEDGEWKPFSPKNPELIELVVLSIKQRLRDYEEQRLLLIQTFAQKAVERAVAPMAVQGFDDVIDVRCIWSEGLPTLLPRTDSIVMEGSFGRRLKRPWAVVEAVCGPFPLDPDLYPPRYLAERWPTAAQWTALTQASEA